ncbi:ABC transporter permease [Microbacterium excoecariae]|uniref:ABC transporter permease n=1 Tax=Microbacterium excoecariae TaxID=2715210 RepID=UPI00140D5A28|nr:ABC transporter permease subunit [Microbacterium excoecariae]NHI16592.1 ABC transporter permease subunit [Microbacterium excoecariae]
MTWLAANLDQIARYAGQHVVLALVPTLLGAAISLPLGWLANRNNVGRGVLLSISGLLYAIPSLPLFIVMPALIGTQILDPLNVVVALTIYALALMLRTTADALASVDGDLRLAATAVGFGGWQRFWGVDLPAAGPVLLAGLRVVSVSTVSLVTVGSLIGVQSLGYFFVDGYQRGYVTEIAVGVVGTVLIALVLDAVIVLTGRLAMPWTRRAATRTGVRA